MSTEPNAILGDSGEHVTTLQERLQRLGYYDGSVDGNYGETTETAVRRFQEAVGLEQDGQVQEATWDAIEHQELLHGNGSHEAGAGDPASGQLSEDGQWWWDGATWQPVDGQASAETTTASDHAPGQLSPDGQWQWDGAEWQPTAGDAALLGFPDPQLQPVHVGDSLHTHDGPGPTSSSTDDTLTGFATGSAELTPEHQAVLARIAAGLNAQPLILGGFVTLTGHADRRGDEAANRELGQRRAEAVRDYLRQLVTDEETRGQIRAYSLGEPSDGPEGDVPSLRKVEIEITRRSYNADLGPHPTDSLPDPSGTPPISVPDILRLPPPSIPPDDPSHPQLPDWFWHELPPRPPDPPLITQISRWLNQTLGTHDLAGVAADVAAAFGFDRSRVQRMLDEAFQSGGEAAVKALLNEAIQRAAGPPSGRPSSPTGPAVEPRPFPSPQVQSPQVPLQ